VPQIVVEPTAKALFAIPALDAELAECLFSKYPPFEPHETVFMTHIFAAAGKTGAAIFTLEALTTTLLAIFYRT
jgi:hypothetical protein